MHCFFFVILFFAFGNEVFADYSTGKIFYLFNNLFVFLYQNKKINIMYPPTGLEVLKSETGEPHCFKFSWLGPTYDEEKSKNCSDKKYKNIPCINPFESTTVCYSD